MWGSKHEEGQIIFQTIIILENSGSLEVNDTLVWKEIIEKLAWNCVLLVMLLITGRWNCGVLVKAASLEPRERLAKCNRLEGGKSEQSGLHLAKAVCMKLANYTLQGNWLITLIVLTSILSKVQCTKNSLSKGNWGQAQCPNSAGLHEGCQQRCLGWTVPSHLACTAVGSTRSGLLWAIVLLVEVPWP